MENDNPAFTFPLDYGGKDVRCEVTMRDNSYDVAFDNRFIGSIGMDDEMEWLQESGTILPQSVVDQIGLKIESRYM